MKNLKAMAVRIVTFFERLKDHSNFFNKRTEYFIHLNHGRDRGWQGVHKHNKKLYAHLKRCKDYTQNLVRTNKKKYKI